MSALHLDDDDAARNAFERAFEANPAAQNLATTLEQFYRKSDDIDSLRSLYERAACDGPAAAKTRFLCSLGELLGDGRLGEATKVLRFRASRDAVVLLGPDQNPLTPFAQVGDSTAASGGLAQP